uniref:ATP-dependent zinc metalloprotease FTSH, chloroplastic n=1 Tax=Ipomoea batatas TaxID=4120 RepID=A0AA51QGZ8_IPOBA|nr:FtsH7 [Ipomoea batatas]
MKMSAALSLSVSYPPICKSHHDSLPKLPNKENPCPRTPLEAKLNRRKLLQSTGLSLLLSARRANAETEAPSDASSSRMSYSRFLEYLDQGAVKKVDLFQNNSGSFAVVEIQNPNLNKIQRVKVQLPGLPKELLRKLKEKEVDFGAYPMEINVIASLLDSAWEFSIPFAFDCQNRGVLKDPEKFTAVGAKIPKGVLLVGPPGTGKTLLAKAIAGEAGVPFFSLSGSEFIEMFVGVGASRVRDLFNKAKKNSPCLVFIDEIDAVGRQRGTGIGGGNDEREQTLNQLLTEMDGFTGNTGSLLLLLQTDLMFLIKLCLDQEDLTDSVGLPDIRGREEILKVHSSNKKLDKDVSLSVIAMRTPGFSGADLANLMNEAAILAGRRGKPRITSTEIDDSIDRIVAGMEGTKMTDGKSKILVAYHEIGHAICASLTPGHDAVQKVSLIPRGQARGLTWFLPGEDPTLVSKQQLFARIVGGLGGRAAEEIIFGEPEITTGAAGDLQQVTQIARQMVTMFGMSEIGPWALLDPSAQSGDLVLRMLARNQMSEKLAEDIDASVRQIIEKAYEIAKNHIKNNREAIDKLVEVLLEKETLTGDEFRAILSEFTQIPSINMVNNKPVRKLIEA